MSNEGTSSPFQARLFWTILELRDQLFVSDIEHPQKYQRARQFDEKFQPVHRAAEATRDAALEVFSLIQQHSRSIRDGKAVKLENNQIHILESIDTSLGQATTKLIDQSVIAIKTGLQTILRDLMNLDIGFLFQKEAAFNAGIENLLSSEETALAEYLKEIRINWLSDLLQLRNSQEHNGWVLRGLKYYIVEPSTLVVELPEILGMPINEGARKTANRVLLFIENMLVYAMQRNSPRWYPIYISEIPFEQRDPEIPKRFRLGSKGLVGYPKWEINYQDAMDFI